MAAARVLGRASICSEASRSSLATTAGGSSTDLPRGTPSSTRSWHVSEKNRMPPLASLLTVLSVQLLINVGMAIIYPTVLSYSEELGAGRSFSGFIVALLPFTSLLCNYPQQRLMEWASLRSMFFFTSAGNVLANVLYACAGLTHSKYTLLIARVLMGMFACNNPVILYIARSVGLNHRSWAMMVLSSVMGAGYVLGPFLAFLTALFCKDFRIDNLVVDQNTLPGWLMAFLWFTLLVLQPFLYVEPSLDDEIMGETLPTEPELSQEQRPGLVAVGLLLFIQVVGGMTFGFWEVFAAMHCTRAWGWSDGTAGLYMASVMGALLVVCVFFSIRVSGKLPDRLVLAWSCLGSTAAAPLLFDYGLPRSATLGLFTAGSFAMLTGCQLFRGSANALCSKVVPNSLQSLMTTMMCMATNVGRGIGPIMATRLGIQAFAGTLLCVMASATLGTACAFGRLRPHRKAT